MNSPFSASGYPQVFGPILTKEEYAVLDQARSLRVQDSLTVRAQIAEVLPTLSNEAQTWIRNEMALVPYKPTMWELLKG